MGAAVLILTNTLAIPAFSRGQDCRRYPPVVFCVQRFTVFAGNARAYNANLGHIFARFPTRWAVCI